MADTFVDEIVSNNIPGRALNRAPVEIVEGDNGRATPIDAAGNAIANDVDETAPTGRALPESVKAKFAEMRAARAAGREVAGDDDEDAPPGETQAEAAAANGDAPPDPTAEVAPADPAAAPPVEDPTAEIKAALARYEAANQALLDELEVERKKPRESGDVKDIAEATKSYLEDSDAALRKFIASSLGVDDPASPDVDAELRLLYDDLTAKMLGVTPDQAHQTKRDAARAKQLWARERRERKVEEQSNSDKATRDAEAKKDEGAAAHIGTQLGTKASDYPLLINLSTTFDGLPPGELVWKVIKRETKAGRIDPKASDEKLIAHAARKIEEHYTGLIAKANQVIPPKPNPSTATPSGNPPPAATKSASPDQRQSPAARTLTTADASVAPATPPAQKPKPKDDKPPVFKNDDERKKWAMRHLRKRPA